MENSQYMKEKKCRGNHGKRSCKKKEKSKGVCFQERFGKMKGIGKVPKT